MEIFHDVEFWIAISFALAMVLLWVKASPMIIGSLDARADQIRTDLAESEKLRKDAEQTLADYKQKQLSALAEAESIIANAREDAERAAKQAEIDLEAALKRREAQAQDKIAQAEAKALAEVRRVAVDIAIEATRKLLVEHLDQAQGSALIDNAITNLPQQLH